MTYKSLLKKLSLSSKDFEDIKNAVKEAEKNTSGEIALALAPESASYAFWEALVAFTSGFLFLVCVFPLSHQICNWLQTFIWGMEPLYLSVFYFLLFAVMVVVMYFLFNIPFIDRIIVPERVKTIAVTNRALRHFTESGVYCTKEHSGILIYVSYFERQVRIVADAGLNEKISPDMWNLISDELTDSIANGNVKEAFISAVRKCGTLLKEKFPADENLNENELADGLVILEDEKWV